jgi:CelD/BcsL family acetyltransferase involved in cellulose biosynthesis
MSLKIEVITQADDFLALRPEWEALMSQTARPCLFTTWDWQWHWWAAYQPGDLWILALRNPVGELVALAPWFIHDLGERGVWVRSIGCVDVTDYLELILREGYEEAALQSLTAFAYEHRARYTDLDFCNIPEDSPTLKLWGPILEAAGYEVTIRQQEVCPVIKLPDTWEAYLDQLDSKQAGELRRKLRHLRGSDQTITWGFIGPEEDIQAALDRFLALMRASSQQKAAFLEDERHVRFFRSVIPALQAKGYLKLSFLQVGGKDAAAYLSFDYRGQIWLYNSGQDHKVAPKLSPGILLLMNIIQAAIESGRSHFDFLRGDEEYKYRMGGVDTAVMMLSAKLN